VEKVQQVFQVMAVMPQMVDPEVVHKAIQPLRLQVQKL
jgi:ferredoxin-fold anticodon binding domain-containing protein